MAAFLCATNVPMRSENHLELRIGCPVGCPHSLSKCVENRYFPRANAEVSLAKSKNAHSGWTKSKKGKEPMPRCFFSSPYRSSVHWPDRHFILSETFMAMRRLRPLKPILHWREAERMDNCIWSPLLHGDWIREGALHHSGEEIPEREMLGWCIWVLRNGPWTHLVQCRTIPQIPGYGRSGMDAEREVAEEMGLKIVTDIKLIHA